MFGTLVVRESANCRQKLSKPLGVNIIIDNPGTQIINLHEWDHQTNLDNCTMAKARIRYIPGKLPGEIPVPLEEQMAAGVAETYTPYKSGFSYVGLFIGNVPFFGLVNAKGRNKDVPYFKTAEKHSVAVCGTIL